METKYRTNWLTIIFFFLIGLFLILGFWQLHRGKEKEQILATLQRLSQSKPISIKELPKDPQEWKYQPVRFSGKYVNKRQFLLDNKVHNGQVGYDVITPVKIPGLTKWVLVNRGWVAATSNRLVLPDVTTGTKLQTITGIIQLPGKELLLKPDTLMTAHWPMLIQQADFKLIEKTLNQPVYPFLVLLDHNAANGFVRQWSMINMQPSKHMAYAIQWFALAGLLIIIYIVMCFQPDNRNREREK